MAYKHSKTAHDNIDDATNTSNSSIPITDSTLEARHEKDIPTDTEKAMSSQSSTNPAKDGHGPMYGKIPGLQTWRRTLIFIALCVGLFLSLMDTSIMATAIYTIALDFNSLGSAFWAILSYQLSYLGFAVAFARLSDFIGRRFAVLLAFTLFVAFSIGCGFAQSINQLIALRALQGIGGAGLYSLALILLIEASTARLMAFTSSFIGAVIAMAGVLGPILGGALTQYATWRWIFWINGPVGGTAMLLFAIAWPPASQTALYDANKRRFSEFDYLGGFLLLAASVLVVFGIQEAGTGSYAWSSSVVMGTLITGCICWVLLFVWEYYVYRNKTLQLKVASMFPFHLVLNRQVALGVISTMLVGYIYFLLIVALPLRFQIVNLRSPTSAGVHLLPLLCFVGLGTFITGIINKKRNNIYYTFIAASVFIVVGSGLFSTVGTSVAIPGKVYGFQALFGLGVGMTFAGISMLVSLSTDFASHAVAQGITSQVRIFGGSIGIAASNAMFNHVCATTLQGILTPTQIADLQSNTHIVTSFDAKARDAVRVAYAVAFQKSTRICLYLAIAFLVINLATWQKNPPPVIRGPPPPPVAANPPQPPQESVVGKNEETEI